MKTSFKAFPGSRTSSSRGLRFGAAAAALLCAFAALPPALAADQGATRAGNGEAMLNFVGADIDSVVRAVGHYTNITFVIDPRVKGTINLVSEKPVSKAQAFQMLSSALRLQGYSVVLNGDYAKVVPEADAKLQATPVQAGKVHGDQIVTQIFRLNYESAQSMVAVLRPLISPNNTINAEPGSNTLVITDYADNMKRLGRIINALDSPSTADLDVIPIRYAVASDIAVMVNRLLEGGGPTQNAAAAAAAADRTMLLADPRTNSVIVRAQSAARANLAKSLIAKLDQPTALPGNIHIVYLRNADAVKLAQTLRSVVTADTASLSQSGSSSSNSFSQNGGGGSAFGNSTNGSSSSMSSNSSSAGLLGGGSSGLGSSNANGPSSSSSLSAAGGAGGFIQADPSTNTLIITASEPVYRNLRTVIDQLDVRRAQVYVESLIVEVTSDTAAELGIQWLGLSGNSNSAVRIGAGTSFSTGGDNLFQQAVNIKTNGIPAAPGNGLTLGVFRQLANGQLGLGALARALESNANANILSVPNLVTLYNEEAKIIVGQNVLFITGKYTTAASGGAAGVNPFQTIERQDIGIALRVRPQITEG
ncbi:MAG: type II secretion system secretin GspD, partial [Burkholderiaceae bacterium]